MRATQKKPKQPMPKLIIKIKYQFLLQTADSIVIYFWSQIILKVSITLHVKSRYNTYNLHHIIV